MKKFPKKLAELWQKKVADAKRDFADRGGVKPEKRIKFIRGDKT